MRRQTMLLTTGRNLLSDGNAEKAKEMYESIIGLGQAQLRDYYNLGIINFQNENFEWLIDQNEHERILHQR